MVCSVPSYTLFILKWLVMCTEVDTQVKFVIVPDPKAFSTLISNNDPKPIKTQACGPQGGGAHL